MHWRWKLHCSKLINLDQIMATGKVSGRQEHAEYGLTLFEVIDRYIIPLPAQWSEWNSWQNSPCCCCLSNNLYYLLPVISLWLLCGCGCGSWWLLDGGPENSFLQLGKRVNAILNWPFSETHISSARWGQNTLYVSCKLDILYPLLSTNLSHKGVHEFSVH